MSGVLSLVYCFHDSLNSVTPSSTQSDATEILLKLIARRSAIGRAGSLFILKSNLFCIICKIPQRGKLCLGIDFRYYSMSSDLEQVREGH